VFRGQKKQLVDLSDDMKIKDLIKLFFTAKTFQDITGLAAIFKEEIERFRKRALRA
jgi:hypothetical protein